MYIATTPHQRRLEDGTLYMRRGVYTREIHADGKITQGSFSDDDNKAEWKDLHMLVGGNFYRFTVVPADYKPEPAEARKAALVLLSNIAINLAGANFAAKRQAFDRKSALYEFYKAAAGDDYLPDLTPLYERFARLDDQDDLL